MAKGRGGSDVAEALASADGVRSFLKVYFHATGIPYAEVARRAGFSSRSYPRDVTVGRRRLTGKALPRLIKGLRLERDQELLLRALFYSENPSEHPDLRPRERWREQVVRARERLRRGPLRKVPVAANLDSAHSLLPRDGGALFELVAALGDPGHGSTLEELRGRTGQEPIQMVRLLERLVRVGLVRYSGDERRYAPTAAHLDLSGLPQNEIVREAFLQASRKAVQAAEAQFSKEDALFLTSSVAIPKSRLAQLKQELRKTMLRFIDSAVEPPDNPEVVVNLTCTFLTAHH